MHFEKNVRKMAWGFVAAANPPIAITIRGNVIRWQNLLGHASRETEWQAIAGRQRNQLWATRRRKQTRHVTPRSAALLAAAPIRVQLQPTR
jgi:hypothetical protein